MSSFAISGKMLLAIKEIEIEMTNRTATAPNLRTRVRGEVKSNGSRIGSNQKSVRKVAVSIGATTRKSRISTAEDGVNSSLRGDFFRSRAVFATRTERVNVSSKSMLQSIALKRASKISLE